MMGAAHVASAFLPVVVNTRIQKDRAKVRWVGA